MLGRGDVRPGIAGDIPAHRRLVLQGIEIFRLAAEQIDHGPIAEQPAQLAFAYEFGEVRREQRREDGVGLCLEQRLHDRSGVDLAEWNRDLDELDRR